MKNDPPFDDGPIEPTANDPLTAAARALLAALKAEPVPSHLSALAKALEEALKTPGGA